MTTRQIKAIKKGRIKKEREQLSKRLFVKFTETGFGVYNLYLDNIERERWSPVKNYPNYFVSTFGRIKSLVKGFPVILLQQVNDYGYLRVTLSNSTGSKSIFVHRLVGIAFKKNLLSKPDINHKNGKKFDNRVENIEWATESENCKHAHLTGLSPVRLGEKHNCAKLKDQQVVEIKRLLKCTNMTQRAIAKIYNISQTAINNINRGKIWKHIKI